MLLQMIVLQVVTFIAIVLVLRKLLYAESAKEVQRLRKLMEENTQKRRELQHNIDASEKAYQEKMVQAAEDIRKLTVKFEEEIKAARSAAMNKTKEEADSIIKAALNAKERFREEASMEMLKNAPALASRIFVEALSLGIREEVHRELVEEVIDKIDKMQTAVFENRGDKLEAAAAYPLAKEKKNEITSIISKKTGREISFSESLEEKIIAGVIIKFGTLIIDGSLDSRLKQIEKEI